MLKFQTWASCFWVPQFLGSIGWCFFSASAPRIFGRTFRVPVRTQVAKQDRFLLSYHQVFKRDFHISWNLADNEELLGPADVAGITAGLLELQNMHSSSPRKARRAMHCFATNSFGWGFYVQTKSFCPGWNSHRASITGVKECYGSSPPFQQRVQKMAPLNRPRGCSQSSGRLKWVGIRFHLFHEPPSEGTPKTQNLYDSHMINGIGTYWNHHLERIPKTQDLYNTWHISYSVGFQWSSIRSPYQATTSQDVAAGTGPKKTTLTSEILFHDVPCFKMF